MSRLSRALRRIDKDMSGVSYSIFEKLEDLVCNSKLYDRVETYYYNVHNFIANLPIFIKHAWHFRTWDSQYCLHVFTDLLTQTAHSIKSNSRHKGATKCYRRCLTAANLLDRAYNSDIDKTISYLMLKNRPYFKKVPGTHYSIMERNYRTEKRIYEGMCEVAHRRSETAEKERKKAAWAYVHKHFESFWD